MERSSCRRNILNPGWARVINATGRVNKIMNGNAWKNIHPGVQRKRVP